MPSIFIGGARSLWLMAAISLTPLGGCAVVDQYGSRATSYNEQTSSSRNSAILLNIMRAAYREPLQFTEISTVTGTASAQGGINAAIPFRVGGTGFTAPNIMSLNPSAQVSGGPNFSVSNLNTQAFYLGLQSSIKTETIAHYLANGANPKVLLSLVLSEFEVENPATNTRAVLRNTGSVQSYGAFRSAIQALLHYGLSVGQVNNPEEKFGPALTEEEARDPKLLSALVQSLSGGPPFTLKEFKTRNGDSKFQLTRPGGAVPRFCFLEQKNAGGETISSGDDQEGYAVSQLHAGGIQRITLDIISYNMKRLPPISLLVDRNSCLSSEKPRMNITFKTRSLEGIFAFVGELVRTQLGLGSASQPSGDPTYDANGNPFYLFRVEQRPPRDGEISANIHGFSYAVAADPSGDDASTQVVQLLSDLLALQSNAKDLPAPNVIAVVP